MHRGGPGPPLNETQRERSLGVACIRKANPVARGYRHGQPEWPLPRWNVSSPANEAFAATDNTGLTASGHKISKGVRHGLHDDEAGSLDEEVNCRN